MHTTEAKKVSVLIAKVTEKFSNLHPKNRKTRARLLKRGFNLDKKLRKVIGRMMPLADRAEIDQIADKMVTWVTDRRANRVGRITANTLHVVSGDSYYRSVSNGLSNV